METITIDIINPKAKSLLKNLADLNLIRIKKKEVKTELNGLLERLRKNSNDELTLEEITFEVEEVRKARFEQQKSNS